MSRRLLLLLVFIPFFAGHLQAGAKLDFMSVDRLTFRYFEEKKWDSVILVGKQALHQDIDYYYLRVRMGIAYFEKQKYMPAIVHLQKARKFNSGDPIVSDYLYHAYILVNRNEEAEILRVTLPKNASDTGLKKRILEWVHFESGYTLSSNNSPKNPHNLMAKDSLFGEQDLYGNSLITNLGLKLKVSNRLSLSMAYSYLNFTRKTYIQYSRLVYHPNSHTGATWDNNNNYSFPVVIHDTNFRYQVIQHEIHLGATLTLPDGFTIMPAIHWVNVSNPITNFTPIIYSFNRKDTSFNNWVAALTVTKDLGIFNMGLNGSWSNLNKKEQIQAGILLTYYPLGNLNFYGTSSITGFFQGKETRLLLSQVVGGKVLSWMWIEGNFYYGDYTNANIFNGSIVYNNTDIIDYRGGLNLVFVVNRHISLSLSYQYFRKESQQLFYIKTPNPLPQVHTAIPRTKNNPYNTNTIIGGITWKL